MSDIRKWLKIMESVPAVFPEQPSKEVMFKQDATLMVDPRVGGGTGRFMHSTPDGAMVDIKGIARELSADDFSAPERDYEDPYQKGNDWFHASVKQDTIGTQRDKPEFRAGDLVKIADVYGSVIGPGFGVFIAYGTTGKDCILSFDNKEIVVPVENVAAVLEQDAKDNFSQTDNDGVLSPMSLGAQNVKIDKEEPAMDQRDEFSKWMSAVEEALSTEGVQELAEVVPDGGDCQCGSWDCPTCFPDPNAMDDQERNMMPSEPITPVGPGMQDPTMGADEMEVELPLVDEEEQEFVEKPKSGKGVKLGDIVQKTEVRPTGGQKSPMTYGEDNLDDSLDEQPMMPDTTTDAYGKAGRYSQEHFGEVDETIPADAPDDTLGMVNSIKYMQDMGLSKAPKNFRPDELAMFSKDPNELRKIHGQVMGGTVDEEAKPTKTKQSFSDFDDMDDILNPRQAHLPANIDEPEGEPDAAGPATPSMPRANPADTRRKVGSMTASDQMRDMMNRINPDAGADEPELPDQPTGQVVVRTAADVPAVISSAMQASGTQVPEWHSVEDLPGFMRRNIRGMGRQVFSMFTRTPLEQIQTIANVDGQGPNSDAEMRAVGGWLRDNAEDLGKVDLSHGMAIPGYKPDVKEYRMNGVRFHVVRDPVGQYIYAYPDQDSVLGGPPMGGGQGQIGNGGGIPQLREGTQDMKPTLFEQMKFDEEIKQIFESLEEAFGKPNAKDRAARTQSGYEKRKSQYATRKADADAVGDEFDEPAPEAPKETSQLARRVGSKPGGKNLIKWMHSRHRLDNEAELSPLKITNSDMHRPLWSEFKQNGNNFVIVSAQNGVAGIKPYSQYIADRKAEAQKKGKSYDPGTDTNVPYQIVAFTNDGAQIDPALLKPEVKDRDKGKEPRYGDPTVSKARMGKIAINDVQNSDNAFDMLTAQIGSINTIWVTGVQSRPDDADNGSINRQGWRVGAIPHDKMAARAELKKPSVPQGDQLNALFKRIRPVMKTLGNQAILQINNRVKRFIDGGNFEGAQDLATKGTKLKAFLATLDTSGDVKLSGPIFAQVRKAIADASGTQVGSQEFNDYVADAATGSASKLGPILDAFRQNLVGLQ